MTDEKSVATPNEDAATGKVTLKRDVDRVDEMALDTSSTKTTRVKK